MRFVFGIKLLSRLPMKRKGADNKPVPINPLGANFPLLLNLSNPY